MAKLDFFFIKETVREISIGLKELRTEKELCANLSWVACESAQLRQAGTIKHDALKVTNGLRIFRVHKGEGPSR